MVDHAGASWKHQNVTTQLHNSVDNATSAVGRAQTNPTDESIQHAKKMIERADNALHDALQNSEDMEPINSLQQQLHENKERLQSLE